MRSLTQAHLAELWDGEISERTISRGLKKIGFTRKKKLMDTESVPLEKRAEFVKKLESVKPSDIVYADEAGMDSRDDYSYGYSLQGERLYALKSGRRQGLFQYDCRFA